MSDGEEGGAGEIVAVMIGMLMIMSVVMAMVERRVIAMTTSR